MLPKFDANKVWQILLDTDEDSHNDDVSVFMAVPTIYAKLIQEYHHPLAKLDHIDIKDIYCFVSFAIKYLYREFQLFHLQSQINPHHHLLLNESFPFC